MHPARRTCAEHDYRARGDGDHGGSDDGRYDSGTDHGGSDDTNDGSDDGRHDRSGDDDHSGRGGAAMTGKSAEQRRKGVEEKQLVLVDTRVLPDIILRTLQAKRLLQTGKASTVSQAARQVGISRTAFYKYRDAVMPYDEGTAGRTITVHLVLRHSPGVISRVLDKFAAVGANILTVNQNIPSGGVANASVSARIDQIVLPVSDFLNVLESIDGVERVSAVADNG